MIRAPRLIPGNSLSPIRRIRLLPNLRLRSPRAATLAAPSLAPAPARRLASSPLGSIIGLLMDPAVTAASAPAAESNGESGGYDDAAEFADAVESGEDGAAAGAMAAGGEEEVRELPEELAKGVVCLECETSPEAEAAGLGRTCRVYIVGTAHVSQVSWFRPRYDIIYGYGGFQIGLSECMIIESLSSVCSRGIASHLLLVLIDSKTNRVLGERGEISET